MSSSLHPAIQNYNNQQLQEDKAICDFLASHITASLAQAENKVWHAHPVWFLDGNPIVGYSKQKAGIRLMFWSGADFNEKDLNVLGSKFKDASIFYNSLNEVDTEALTIWLQKATNIQWDYKNLVKRKGVLERLK